MSKFKVGQIWKSCDSRDHERYLEIIAIPNDLCVQVKNTKTGRKTIITQYRMKPNPRGYVLIKEIEE